MADDIKTYQSGDLTIKINRTACIGCSTCAAMARKTFEMDEDMKSAVKKDPHDNLQAIIEAAHSCAVEAITVIETKTGKKLS